ncbi:alpha/beta hydrolase [Modestobacter muralis]|uniref:Alpha/beta hydrolase n=1 Tax=Modestobacter muralis TaxID=1608614 RepID=A0A6P0HEM9_9ACTN|nr:alpha/beta hydrolase [Modestobacter muralis]NEN52684.1 alpha/beta hydrolase [Modestobacter muralis]
MTDARLSDVPLHRPGGHLPPWPGAMVPVTDGEVFVRHTPWRGPVPAEGAPDDGPPADAPRERALYVHGLGGAATNWTDFAGLLAVRFDGWALDLPGFGQSAPPRRYSVQGHVQAVVDVLEWIVARPGPGQGEPVHLAGNSLGGLVTVLVAARRPDLVATLTLISAAMPVYRVPAALDRAVALVLLPGVPALASRRLATISPEQRVRGLLQTCFGDPTRVPPERVAEAVEEARRRDAQPWSGQALTRSLRGLMTSYLRVGRANAWRTARSVQAPTLVVWGDRDRLVDPRLAPRLAAVVPDSRLQVQAGVGHLAMLEAPEPTARAVLALAEDVAARRAPDHAVRSVAGQA